MACRTLIISLLESLKWNTSFQISDGILTHITCMTQILIIKYLETIRLINVHINGLIKFWKFSNSRFVSDKIRNMIKFGTDQIRNSRTVMTARTFRIRSVPNLIVLRIWSLTVNLIIGSDQILNSRTVMTARTFRISRE